MDHQKVRKGWCLKYKKCFLFSIDSYGNHNRSSQGNSLLDDLDSFVVGPLRPGPPVIKNFYSESPLVTNRPQVRRIEFNFIDWLLTLVVIE